MPWGFLLEGHAYWHLLTGLGGYYYITYGKWCEIRILYAVTKLMMDCPPQAYIYAAFWIGKRMSMNWSGHQDLRPCRA